MNAIDSSTDVYSYPRTGKSPRLPSGPLGIIILLLLSNGKFLKNFWIARFGVAKGMPVKNLLNLMEIFRMTWQLFGQFAIAAGRHASMRYRDGYLFMNKFYFVSKDCQ